MVGHHAHENRPEDVILVLQLDCSIIHERPNSRILIGSRHDSFTRYHAFLDISMWPVLQLGISPVTFQVILGAASAALQLTYNESQSAGADTFV